MGPRAGRGGAPSAAGTWLPPALDGRDRNRPRGARSADAARKDAASRPHNPTEISHREFWGHYVAADWPAPARAAVVAAASALCRRMALLDSHRAARPGTDRLLRVTAEAGLPVAIVSNALSGAVHREFFAALGWGPRFAAEIYSDEVGVRKPNPEIIDIAARAVGVRAADTWFVGDNFDRDVVCGRRAEVGGMILMESDATYRIPFAVRDRPDVVVADAAGLVSLVRLVLPG